MSLRFSFKHEAIWTVVLALTPAVLGILALVMVLLIRRLL